MRLIRGRTLAPWWLFLLACPMGAADDFQVTAGTVEDQRFSDERFGGLSVELLFKGSGVADVRAVRIKIKSAKDDLGTPLTKPDPDAKPRDFEEFSADRHPGPEVRLLSPRRDATKVELAGEVELFIPTRDPNTRLRVDKFLSQLDKPISNAALNSAKVEVTPLSSKEYKARQAKNRPTKEQIAAEGKKSGASDKEIQEALALMDALSALGGEEPSANSILVETKDPDGKIISVDVAKADGSDLHASTRGSSGGRDLKMIKIDLDEKAPADAALVITLRTAKSLVTVPLNFKEVALP